MEAAHLKSWNAWIRSQGRPSQLDAPYRRKKPDVQSPQKSPKDPGWAPIYVATRFEAKNKKTCALNLKKKNENNNNMPDKYQRITTYVIQVKNLWIRPDSHTPTHAHFIYVQLAVKHMLKLHSHCCPFKDYRRE